MRISDWSSDVCSSDLGWDCHGLPIEWKIEEKYRAAGQDKDSVPIVELRKECREFAQHWINIQREEFKRLGVEGDWDNPRSEEHTSELQSLMRISYAVFCLKKKTKLAK